MTQATVSIISDADAVDRVNEAFDGNWNLISANTTMEYKSGSTITTIVNNYDENWHLTNENVNVSEYVGNFYTVTEGNYDASGNLVGAASAAWGFTNSGIGYENWTTGTHQLSLTETTNPGSTAPLYKVTDVAFDTSGAMTGAKIFTYDIQGQAFTSTEEDYDATWHLTSWHGMGPGYDQTVNYMV